MKKWQTGGLKSRNERSACDSSKAKSDSRKKPHRKRGVSLPGRPNCLDDESLGRLLEAYYSHPYSFRELADMFGVSRMTVWRAVQEAHPVMV